jgi:hypothetical protein
MRPGTKYFVPSARLRVAALLNASAGTIERQGAGTLRDVLASALEKHGIVAVLEFLPGSELRPAAERARQQVIDGKLDAIIVKPAGIVFLNEKDAPAITPPYSPGWFGRFRKSSFASIFCERHCCAFDCFGVSS